ncbi:MAG: KH domain-containing protein [Candidatus ainarchaeum sp.]|jgi:NusA-like KH domain protein|nr:KH domain-containing protein [Candidatus ainarchaeum sp.]MDD3085951.1 KH domain-containing protein [Candidatus ainarchaeum sp.]MDD4128768.1 KH domain-containing protein [Candidatus ainarchaeum sp.]MDD4467745.1 KH domain-containing protein [Candidatus ainarchaeum sp.]HPM86020.1 KH domain-containing protein [archaeon]
MKLNMGEIRIMNAVQQLTRVMPKDCIIEENLVSFLIPQNLMGKAIGKKAINIKDLEKNLKKRVEFVASYEKVEDVFANALEVNYLSSKKNDSKIIINLDSVSKAKVMKNNSRTKRVKELIKRNYGVELIIK